MILWSTIFRTWNKCRLARIRNTCRELINYAIHIRQRLIRCPRNTMIRSMKCQMTIIRSRISNSRKIMSRLKIWLERRIKSMMNSRWKARTSISHYKLRARRNTLLSRRKARNNIRPFKKIPMISIRHCSRSQLISTKNYRRNLKSSTSPFRKIPKRSTPSYRRTHLISMLPFKMRVKKDSTLCKLNGTKSISHSWPKVKRNTLLSRRKARTSWPSWLLSPNPKLPLRHKSTSRKWKKPKLTSMLS